MAEPMTAEQLSIQLSGNSGQLTAEQLRDDLLKISGWLHSMVNVASDECGDYPRTQADLELGEAAMAIEHIAGSVARISGMAAAPISYPGFPDHCSYNGGAVWGLAQRCAYFVAPRRSLLSMPAAWQQQFVDLISEANNRLGCDAFPMYSVQRRDEHGRFMQDPLADYRHTGPLPPAAPEPTHA